MEDYIHGNLSTAEREQFEAEMTADEQLREEVELHQQLISSVETESVRQLLEKIHQENFESDTPVISMSSRRTYFPLAVAASVALLVLAGWWAFFGGFAQPSYYATYFSPDPGLPTTLGYSTNTAFAEGMVSYKLEEYAEARTYWEPLLEADPANDTLNYYTGVAFLADEQPDAAINYLKSVASSEPSAFSTSAQWYLALAYLETAQEELAKALLEDLATSENPYQNQSTEILAEID